NWNLADAHMRMRPPQWDVAFRHFTAALTVRPRSAALHSNIGCVLVQQDRPAAAIAAFRKALELNPASVQARLNLATQLAGENRHAEAEAELRHLIKLEPTLAEPHRLLGFVLTDNPATWKQAREHFDKALDLDPRCAAAYADRGRLAVQQLNLQEAMK